MKFDKELQWNAFSFCLSYKSKSAINDLVWRDLSTHNWDQWVVGKQRWMISNLLEPQWELHMFMSNLVTC